MRKLPILTLAILLAAMIPAIRQVHAAAKTIEGIVSDTMCGNKHMMPNKSDAQCIQECIKSGSSYALVVGDKVYTLAAKPQTIAPLAGKHVKIEGNIKGNTLTVTSIHETKAAMSHGMPM